MTAHLWLNACLNSKFGKAIFSTRALSSSTNICAVNIATQGDAVDFGDTSESSAQTSGCSNGHGGLG